MDDEAPPGWPEALRRFVEGSRLPALESFELEPGLDLEGAPRPPLRKR